MFNNIYKNRKVLVTGHTGFKGSWLINWLQKLGAEVVGLSLKPETSPNHFDLLDTNINSEIGDIRNKEFVSDIVKKHKPEIIFHLAAQAIVRESYTNPLETLETNIIGTANIFEACRKQDFVKAIINVTTDKCYENKEREKPYKENDRLGGHDIYSSSKACSELITSSFRDSFFNIKKYKKEHNILLATMRAGNVIGGGDWSKNRIIPDIIRAVEKKEKLLLRNPNSTRPWQHVLEPLSAYLLIGQKLLQEKPEFATAWNVADINNTENSVLNLVKTVKQEWNKFEYDFDKSENHHEANLLLLDSSAINSKTGWKNLWDFKQTIENTIQWYKIFYENNELDTNSQTDKYVADAIKTNAVWTN